MSSNQQRLVDVDALKRGADIVEVISQYVELKKDGAEYRACCPFHDEKTPSFTVIPNKQMYYCFGCGAHGDVIDFITEHLGVSFKEAVEILGGKQFTGDAVQPKRVDRFDPYAKHTPVETTHTIKVGDVVEVWNPKREGEKKHPLWSIKPEAVYEYPGQGYVLRTTINGKKITPMVRYCRPRGWTLYPFDDSRPLYNYRDSDCQVLVVEGEKCADYLQSVVGDRLNVVTWAGGASGVNNTDWNILRGRRVILWPDNDTPGFNCMIRVAEILDGVAEQIKTIVPGSLYEKGWDCADYKWCNSEELFTWCKEHLHPHPAAPLGKSEALPDLPARKERPPTVKPDPEQIWEQHREMLIWKNEKIVSNVNNTMCFLTFHPRTQGLLAYNDFSKEVNIMRKPPWTAENCDYPRRLTDVDDTRATAWLERVGIQMSINNVHHSIVSSAHHNKYNPLQDYLNSLTWDGTPRLSSALNTLFGCEDNDYSRTVCRKFFIGAIARAMKPGCKMDNVLILEGDQGIKKSSGVAALFGEQWFTDELADIGSKDSAMQAQGVWCIEIAELATMSRAEADRTKEWISRQVDKFRPPYGRNIIDAPRQCVLIGTVNPQGGYLKDATGARRFWPIECKRIDIDRIHELRDQLWAEAFEAYQNGERWWLEMEEANIVKKEQQQRYDSDVWEDDISVFIQGRDFVTTTEIMSDCLNMQHRERSVPSQNRVAKVLTSLGWRRIQRRYMGRRQWVYVRNER